MKIGLLNKYIDKDGSFTIASTSAEEWLGKADQLMRAAGKIDPYAEFKIPVDADELHKTLDILAFSLSSVYFMLLGYSFENLLKGILLLREGSVATEDNIKDIFDTHSLTGLLEKIGNTELTFTKEEKEFFEELEEYVLWIGRYPMPKKKCHVKVQATRIDKVQHERRLALWRRVAEYLQSESQKV